MTGFFNVLILLASGVAILNAASSAVPSSFNFGQLTQWGLAGAIIVFTLWRDWQREGIMTRRNQELEDYIRNKMAPVIEANNQALKDFTDVIRKCPK